MKEKEELPVNFRLAKEEDAPELAMLRKAVWNETYQGIYPQEMLDSFDLSLHENKFLQQITARDTYVYIMEAEAVPVGYFSFGRPLNLEKRPEDLVLHSLYLLQSQQGRGIARRVFTFLIGFAEKHQLIKLYNSCNAHNQNALGFYKNMGGKVLYADVGHEDPAEDSVYLEYLIREMQ